ncbi:MAG TPA: glycoside hydrolase family 2 TIM barrel-domain containing protein [Fimbriimonadaceae bacterium]|nr:glycoside hydrolase family 2 TIM barrel-domain containing protein [Fimbriimonadaceae bacterium]
MIPLACLAVIAMSHSDQNPTWAPKQAPIMTRWAKNVSPTKVHPEYPRPQLVRKDWLNLNGLWDLEVRSASGNRFSGKILVPFPVESALSGVMERVQPNDTLVYRRSFRVPPGWKGKRTRLNFGAVDWETQVLVNGREVGAHKGGYDPFSFDITDALADSGDQSLEIRVKDPTDSGPQPRGKQVLKPEGIWYTPTSGIWQTVWLEPVPGNSIAALKVEGRLDGTLLVDLETQVASNAPRPRGQFQVELTDGSRKLTAESTIGTPARIKVENPKLWSPESPTLYALKVTWAGDEVSSYAAFRKVELGKDEQGRTRILLNGKPYFLIGPLDQGFWPDGLYAAPTDAALKYDLEMTKKWGFNFVRKHVKVEPWRWYYHCDKLGLLVFQDMPSGDKYIGGADPDIEKTPEAAEQFKTELTALIEKFKFFPSVVGWVVFNEGWGQWRTAEMTDFTRNLDPTRLIVSASGWTDRKTGDLIDWHIYPGPGAPQPEPERASFLGEFGGLGLPIPENMWQKEGWGYRSYKTKGELTDALVALFQNLRLLIGDPGLSGAVYTQTTDVEQEVNGIMTYDRTVVKPDVRRLADVVKKLFLPPPTLEPVVPTSEKTGITWAYTTERPTGSFEQPGFSDSNWKRGPGGFGTEGTPGAIVRTVWNTPNIWLRREIDVPSGTYSNPQLRIHHDEDVEVYLNGKLMLKRTGYTSSYILVPIDKKLLKDGKQVIAVHCKQTRGGQYIDVGIVDLKG